MATSVSELLYPCYFTSLFTLTKLASVGETDPMIVVRYYEAPLALTLLTISLTVLSITLQTLDLLTLTLTLALTFGIVEFRNSGLSD